MDWYTWSVSLVNRMSADWCSWILDIDSVLYGQIKKDIAIGRLEEIGLRVPAPTKSLRHASDTEENFSSSVTCGIAIWYLQGPKRRSELKNCQTWMSDYIYLLDEESYVPVEALDIIKNAAKNWERCSNLDKGFVVGHQTFYHGFNRRDSGFVNTIQFRSWYLSDSPYWNKDRSL